MNLIPSSLNLYYGPEMIGHVTDVFFSDQTWYGIFERGTHASSNNPVIRRVLEFISFCVDWNERTANNQNNPPDASEFDRYSDLVNSDLWHMRNPQGDVWHLDEAPVFFSGGDVSWRAR
jgi:hypothetical protein